MKRLLSLTSGDSFYASCLLFFIALPIAGVVSPVTMNHPFWIVVGYLFFSMFARLVQGVVFPDQYEPEVKIHVAIGPLRILAASVLLATAIAGLNDFALLSIGIASVFLVIGIKSLVQAGIFLGEKIIEREQVRRVKDRQAEMRSKQVLAAIDRWMEEQEKARLDDSLFDDLADFLDKADIK